MKSLFEVFFIVLFLAIPGYSSDVTNVPAGYDPFYKKFMDCGGIPVVSSEKVSDRAFYRLKLLLDKVLAGRPDVRQALVDEGFRYIIISQHEEVTDIPEYSDMVPKEYWNQRARGFGGETTSCGEENLLLLPGDRYYNESIFIHELAHGIHMAGLAKCEPDFQAKLEKLYRQAMDKGLYKDDYAATDPAEYWAEGFQAFFDCDNENNYVHNYVNTREELIEYDKSLADLIAQSMRLDEDNDWRYYDLVKAAVIESVPAELNKTGQFARYVWCGGYPILATESVSDDEMIMVYELLRDLFHYRYDLLRQLSAAGSAIVIYSKTDDYVPDYAAGKIEVDSGSLRDGKKWLAAGFGRLVYQLAFAAYDYIDDDVRAKLIKAFADNKGRWANNPEDERIYFAAGVLLYFDGGSVCGISSRTELKAFDSELAEIVFEIFKYADKKQWTVPMTRWGWSSDMAIQK